MLRSSKKKIDGGKKPAISFYAKEKMTCTICRKPFPREEMLSGSGRMIAGELTDELHRVFEPSAKYGQIYPLIYPVGACPNCHTALFWSDFKPLPSADAEEKHNSFPSQEEPAGISSGKTELNTEKKGPSASFSLFKTEADSAPVRKSASSKALSVHTHKAVRYIKFLCIKTNSQNCHFH